MTPSVDVMDCPAHRAVPRQNAQNTEKNKEEDVQAAAMFAAVPQKWMFQCVGGGGIRGGCFVG